MAWPAKGDDRVHCLVIWCSVAMVKRASWIKSISALLGASPSPVRKPNHTRDVVGEYLQCTS